MAYSDSFPAVRPVFQSDFANGGRIDPRISYSRSTTGTYFGTDKHLSSENLIKHSEGTAVWGGTATVTYNYTNGPDGVTSTALRLESASGTERYRYSTGGQFVSGTAYTVSCWVKSNTGVAQTFRFMCSTTAYQSANLTTHATDWTRVTATITPNTTNIFAGFVFLSANTNDISVWGLQVNTGSSALDYQATTTQIHREYAPTLQTAAINAPRFEYSASDSASEAIGQSRGLLIEGSSTNLLVNSADFGGLWQTLNTTTQSSAAIAPDGTLTATAYRENAGAGSKRLLCYYTHSGTDFTISVYAKLLGNTRRLVLRESQSSGLQTVFDLASGSVVTGDGSIQSVGNGWYRCELNGSHSSTIQAAGIYLVPASSDGSDVITGYTGDGYSGLLLAHPQAENQSFASSYINTGTSGSTATRAADSASMVSSSLFDNGGGTLYAEASQNVLDAYNGVFAVSDGTGANTIEILGNSSSFRGQVVNANSTNASFIGGTITVGQFNKHALTFSSSEASYYVNGSEIGTTDSSVVVPTVSEIDIGNVAWSRPLNGHIRKVALYAEPISETAAAALTS